MCMHSVKAGTVFLSTPSARRATAEVPEYCRDGKFLSTPSARRATENAGSSMLSHRISIHALREEGDAFSTEKTASVIYFYPRPPRGGRRNGGGQGKTVNDFYPRPPRGGRHNLERRMLMSGQFLSTPSARRATGGGCHYDNG